MSTAKRIAQLAGAQAQSYGASINTAGAKNVTGDQDEQCARAATGTR